MGNCCSSDEGQAKKRERGSQANPSSTAARDVEAVVSRMREASSSDPQHQGFEGLPPGAIQCGNPLTSPRTRHKPSSSGKHQASEELTGPEGARGSLSSSGRRVHWKAEEAVSSAPAEPDPSPRVQPLATTITATATEPDDSNPSPRNSSKRKVVLFGVVSEIDCPLSPKEKRLIKQGESPKGRKMESPAIHPGQPSPQNPTHKIPNTTSRTLRSFSPIDLSLLSSSSGTTSSATTGTLRSQRRGDTQQQQGLRRASLSRSGSSTTTTTLLSPTASPSLSPDGGANRRSVDVLVPPQSQRHHQPSSPSSPSRLQRQQQQQHRHHRPTMLQNQQGGSSMDLSFSFELPKQQQEQVERKKVKSPANLSSYQRKRKNESIQHLSRFSLSSTDEGAMNPRSPSASKLPSKVPSDEEQVGSSPTVETGDDGEVREAGGQQPFSKSIAVLQALPHDEPTDDSAELLVLNDSMNRGDSAGLMMVPPTGISQQQQQSSFLHSSSSRLGSCSSSASRLPGVTSEGVVQMMQRWNSQPKGKGGAV